MLLVQSYLALITAHRFLAVRHAGLLADVDDDAAIRVVRAVLFGLGIGINLALSATGDPPEPYYVFAGQSNTRPASTARALPLALLAALGLALNLLFYLRELVLVRVRPRLQAQISDVINICWAGFGGVIILTAVAYRLATGHRTKAFNTFFLLLTGVGMPLCVVLSHERLRETFLKRIEMFLLGCEAVLRALQQLYARGKVDPYPVME